MTDNERAEARAKAQVEWLRANGAMNWVWPDERNRFDTGLPVPPKRHSNAYKCNFTQLPGCANARHQRRQRALNNRSGSIASAR